MEATYTDTASYERDLRPVGVARLSEDAVAVLAEIAVAGVRGDDFDRTFSSAPGAQFAALPASSKQRLWIAASARSSITTNTRLTWTRRTNRHRPN